MFSHGEIEIMYFGGAVQEEQSSSIVYHISYYWLCHPSSLEQRSICKVTGLQLK